MEDSDRSGFYIILKQTQSITYRSSRKFCAVVPRRHLVQENGRNSAAFLRASKGLNSSSFRASSHSHILSLRRLNNRGTKPLNKVLY